MDTQFNTVEDLSGSSIGNYESTNGSWVARVYKLFKSEYELDCDMKIGADMHLEFIPSKALEPTSEIRLIQFKRPLNPVDTTEAGWAIDRWSGHTSPWYGWNDATKMPYKRGLSGWDYEKGKPKSIDPEQEKGIGATTLLLDKRKADKERVDMMNAFQKQRQSKMPSKPFWNLPKSEKEVMGIGKVFQNGRRENGDRKVQQAFLWDTPRDLTRVENKTLEFATYVYDAKHDIWLGGVGWGVNMSVSDGPHVTLRRLEKLSSGPPLEQHAEVVRLWNERSQVQHRLRIP
ncbi:hypothetical protein BKA63DRAFT_502210 [Paraphoma chrysanthemicola]|nr:hypothetical protein BKA63DRAFT_502210 [Paraphoma chrysanthemicola]